AGQGPRGREPGRACPPSAGYRLRKFARRNRGPVLTAAAVLAALLAGTGVAAWQAVRATRAADAEADQRQRADRQAVEAKTNEQLALHEKARADHQAHE